MKVKNILILVLSILLILIVIDIAYISWFAKGVGYRFPPIKTYKYDGDANKFVNKLKAYEMSNSNLKIDIIDTIGDKQTGRGYEMIIKYKRNKDGDTLRYHLKCVFTSLNITTIKLIGAHDLNNNTGGYGLKTKGMEILLRDFNSVIIDSLKKNYGVVIKPSNQD